MARAGARGLGLRVALQCLCLALRVARVAPGQQPPPPPPAHVAAENWASSAAHGATAVASNSGYWVRVALRERGDASHALL